MAPSLQLTVIGAAGDGGSLHGASRPAYRSQGSACYFLVKAVKEQAGTWQPSPPSWSTLALALKPTFCCLLSGEAEQKGSCLASLMNHLCSSTCKSKPSITHEHYNMLRHLSHLNAPTASLTPTVQRDICFITWPSWKAETTSATASLSLLCTGFKRHLYVCLAATYLLTKDLVK